MKGLPDDSTQDKRVFNYLPAPRSSARWPSQARLALKPHRNPLPFKPRARQMVSCLSLGCVGAQPQSGTAGALIRL